MGLERLAQAAVRGVDQRAGPALVALALFAIGVVFGALAVGSLGEQDRQQLAGAVSDLFVSLGRGAPPVAPGAALLRAVGRQLKMVALFWALGITVVGSLGVLAMMLLRGLAAGFAAGLLGAELGWRGTLFSAAALLPQNLIAVPALVLAAAGAVHFSALVCWGGLRRDRMRFQRELMRYNGWMLTCLGALLAGAVAEAYLTPYLMQLVARL